MLHYSYFLLLVLLSLNSYVITKILPLSGSYLGIELHSKDRYVVLRVCGGGNAHGRAALRGRQPGRSDVSDYRYSRHAATGNDTEKSRKSSLTGNPSVFFFLNFYCMYVCMYVLGLILICRNSCIFFSSSNVLKWAPRWLRTPSVI